MREFALTGRTIGTTYHKTYEEAYAEYLALDPKIIEYDAEVEICRWDGNEWVNARKRRNGGQIWRERIAERRKRREA